MIYLASRENKPTSMAWHTNCTIAQTARNINTPIKLCGSTILKAIVPVIKKKAIYSRKSPQPIRLLSSIQFCLKYLVVFYMLELHYSKVSKEMMNICLLLKFQALSEFSIKQ